jgi:hypothetical protein
MFSARKILPHLVTLLCAVACGNGDAARTTVAADTAGVARPALELHVTDAAFISEPVALAVSDRAIFVADGGTNSMLEYTRDGQFMRSIGNRGHGAGEFGAPTALAIVGDSILAVSDAALRQVSLFSLRDYKFLRAVAIPGGIPFTLAATGDTLLFGVLDVQRHTSMVRLVVGDSAATQLGVVAPALLHDSALASSYPFAVAAPAKLGYRVGFVGSNLIYHVDTHGQPLDSISPPRRFRRGVPDNPGARVADESSAQRSAPSTSVLTAIGRMQDGSTALLYVDLDLRARAVAGKAFLSTLSKFNVPQCIDVAVPLRADGRPMFAFHGDTLFVVQNNTHDSERAVVSVVSAFSIPSCNDAESVQR